MPKVFLRSRGNKICAFYEEKGKPACILCHGFSSSMDNKTNKALAPLLESAGISTFRIDLFGHGESEGKLEDITLTQAAEDIGQAIDYLKANQSIIGLFGSSFGGAASIIAASRSPELKALALSSPVTDFMSMWKSTSVDIDKWEKSGMRVYVDSDGSKHNLKSTYLHDIKGYDLYELARRIMAKSMIVHGSLDEDVPLSQSMRLYRAIPGCELHIVNGADHHYKEPEHFEKRIRLISDFLIANTK
jgi:pimeloyl-ACP methyl ester carboxylesterase